MNEEESEERGMFRRASAEVLASRKIFKTRRYAVMVNSMTDDLI